MQTEVLRTGTFGIEGDLHKYLDAEKSINLVDLKCTACLLKNNCKMCCHTNDPRSVAELEETRLINESIQCVSLPESPDKFMFLLDYPELPGVELTQKYLAGQVSNQNVATQSSLNLQRKLEREGYLSEFHTQIWDSVEKGEFVEVTYQVREHH